MNTDELRALIKFQLQIQKRTAADVAFIIEIRLEKDGEGPKRESIQVILSGGKDHSIPVYSEALHILMGRRVLRWGRSKRVFKLPSGTIDHAVLKSRILSYIQQKEWDINWFSHRYQNSRAVPYAEDSIRCALLGSKKERYPGLLCALYVLFFKEIPEEIPSRTLFVLEPNSTL